MTSNIETAATVDPNDPASLQLVADSARASQNAATTISDYTTQAVWCDDRRSAHQPAPVVDRRTTSPP